MSWRKPAAKGPRRPAAGSCAMQACLASAHSGEAAAKAAGVRCAWSCVVCDTHQSQGPTPLRCAAKRCSIETAACQRRVGAFRNGAAPVINSESSVMTRRDESACIKRKSSPQIQALHLQRRRIWRHIITIGQRSIHRLGQRR